MRSTRICLTVLASLVFVPVSQAQDSLAKWVNQLTFYASFDQSADAEFSRGEPRIFTAADLTRQQVEAGIRTDAVTRSDEGRWGACLRFHDVSRAVVFFQGKDNVPYHEAAFGMTVSFWMRLNPDEDLKPGYVDPLQITDKQWNNAALFVDFTKDDQPRHFRLGVFSDYAFWNPQDVEWDNVAADDRPLITVTRPPFDRSRWTHVAITLDQLNTADQPATACLYLNGQLRGTLKRPQKFSWDPAQVAVMLGIQYIGDLDDFAIFSGAMDAAAVAELAKQANAITSLR